MNKVRRLLSEQRTFTAIQAGIRGTVNTRIRVEDSQCDQIEEVFIRASDPVDTDYVA